MKKMLIIPFLLFSFASFCQPANIRGSEPNVFWTGSQQVTYMDKPYKMGDIIRIAFGSNRDKSFAHISVDSGSLKKDYSNFDAIIERVYLESGKVTVKARFINIVGSKMTIDLVQAVRNQEIR